MRREIICGLDIGSTKLSAVIGEFNRDGLFKLLARAQAKADGIERGKVLDMEKFTRTVERVMESVQANSLLKPGRFVIGVGTDCLKIHHYRKILTISEKGREIRASDIKKLLNSALDIAVPLDHEVLHIFPQEFSLDGQGRIKDPQGMLGSKLSVRVSIVSVATSLLYNLKKCIYNAGYDIDSVVFSGLASSFAFLSEEERIQGVIFIEVGGGLTSLIKFKENCPVFLEVIPFGGIDIDEIIAEALGIPLSRAEELKNNYAALDIKQDKNKVILEKTEREITREKLDKLILSAMERLLFRIKRKSEHSNILDYTPSGIVLGGGLFLLDGFAEKAEDFFHLPAKLGTVRGLEDLTQEKRNIYSASTAVGLIYFDKFKRKRELPPSSANPFQRILQRAKGIFEEYF